MRRSSGSTVSGVGVAHVPGRGLQPSSHPGSPQRGHVGARAADRAGKSLAGHLRRGPGRPEPDTGVTDTPRQIMEQVPGGTASGNAPVQEPRLLLRGGRRPDVDGRTDRQGINAERVDEALATDPDTVSTACPHCLVMLGDAISAKKASGEARETLEVVDVAQVLMRSVAPSAKTAGPAAQTKRPPA